MRTDCISYRFTLRWLQQFFAEAWQRLGFCRLFIPYRLRMKGQKTSLNLYVQVRLKAAAQAVAEATGTNVSALVEAALKEYLASRYGLSVDPDLKEVQAELRRRGIKLKQVGG